MIAIGIMSGTSADGMDAVFDHRIEADTGATRDDLIQRNLGRGLEHGERRRALRSLRRPDRQRQERGQQGHDPASDRGAFAQAKTPKYATSVPEFGGEACPDRGFVTARMARGRIGAKAGAGGGRVNWRTPRPKPSA